MAVPLLEFLLRYATPAERTIVEEAVAARAWGRDLDLFFPGGPPDREGDRRRRLRAQAEAVLAAILRRVLAEPRPPSARALDPSKARRVRFDLETLLSPSSDVDWLAGRCGRFEAIEVEEAPDLAPRKQTGAPGRPGLTSMPLIEREFERRVRDDQHVAPFAEEVRQLIRWLVENHPDMPAPSPRTVENKVRPAYRANPPK